ncbi:MAG: bifunctional diaminohydroxyphosphoribosylaminopyrimidine deaminase/5-amino-6-(5-phosphoribosylamino)uracil reductase RibD [Lachnospiraceae bacterium]|jgi:diaminohydroxyphosphoribosylaminopyrimidine deaminase/5-amino-6-(5-phosphoribosylamino)uracil reductase|nr:bifunctional diaminohydroxyphosphoribosylaminopyrimidine deaminase/5-amino-6-(5-phosphoribosylamino)uracil reductase RibD [Lachnospiraceae bacterium]
MPDKKYMERAIALAEKGEGWCHPNPKVGAVIVKDGRVIGEGYHAKYGELHAERNAIASLKESAEGADLYVTLEPCCHYGKTPPCTEAIIENKIGRVIVGSRDPNPKVAGGGVRALREAGVEVIEDFMREECDRLNPVFFHYITTGRPYVVMKYAMTLDGKIATKTGASRWITGEESRMAVQQLRHALMGIMVGIGTVVADDPMLNCRLENGRSPIRIVTDSGLNIPLESKIAKSARDYKTIVACALPELPEGEILDGDTPRSDPASARLRDVLETGIRVVNVPDPGSLENREPGVFEGCRTDLAALMDFLGKEGIDSVLLEGGGTLNESALRAGIVDEVRAFVAPKIFGGKAPTPVGGGGVAVPDKADRMKFCGMEQYGDDVMLRYVRKDGRP